METPRFADGTSLDNSCSGSHEDGFHKELEISNSLCYVVWCLMMAAGAGGVEAVISLFRSRSIGSKIRYDTENRQMRCE